MTNDMASVAEHEAPHPVEAAGGTVEGAQQQAEHAAGNMNLTSAPDQAQQQVGQAASGLGGVAGLQQQIMQAVQPILTNLHQQIGQMVQQQMDQALEPVREHLREQLDQALEPVRSSLQQQLEQALEPVRASMQQEMEKALEPVRSSMQQQVEQALRSAFQ
jgi:hypothetical protein